jgi:hypothetical protein
VTGWADLLPVGGLEVGESPCCSVTDSRFPCGSRRGAVWTATARGMLSSEAICGHVSGLSAWRFEVAHTCHGRPLSEGGCRPIRHGEAVEPDQGQCSQERVTRTSHHRAAWVIGVWSLADVSARFRNRWRFGAERGRAAPSPRAGRRWRGLAACGVWVVRRSRRRSSGPGQERTRAGADAPRPWRARPGGPRCGPGRRS